VADRFLATNNQGMACIVSALESDHQIRSCAQVVYDLAFAFITPLGAYDRYIRHEVSPLFQRESPGK
jgi:hypothetical protein